MKKHLNVIFVVLSLTCSTPIAFAGSQAGGADGTFTISASYDAVWQAAQNVLQEIDVCTQKECFLKVEADPATKKIKAFYKEAPTVDALFKLSFREINKDSTEVVIQCSVMSEYTNSLYGIVLKRTQKEMVQAEDAKRVADQIEYAATGKNPIDNRVLLEVRSDATKARVGSPLTIDYFLAINEQVTANGFARDPEVKGYLTYDPDAETPKKPHEFSYFGLLFDWNKVKNRASVAAMYERSPALGLLAVNDQILAINGKKIKNFRHLVRRVTRASFSHETRFKILRYGKELEVSVVPERIGTAGIQIPSFGFLAVYDPDKRIVYIRDARNSGLLDEDVIQTIDGTPIKSMGDWMKIKNQADIHHAYSFSVLRSSKEQIIKIQPSYETPNVKIKEVYPAKNQKNANASLVKKKINGKDYSVGRIKSLRFIFDKPGTYRIDPGSILVTLRAWNLFAVRTIESQPIEIVVSEANKGNVVG